MTRQGRAARLESPVSEDLILDKALNAQTMLCGPAEALWFLLIFIYPFQVSGSVDKFQNFNNKESMF